MQPLYHFSQNYIQPFIHHRSTQRAFYLVVEVIQIMIAKIFLQYLGCCSLINPKKISKKKIYNIIILAPIQEEIIFRFFLLRGMRWVQSLFNQGEARALSSLSESYLFIDRRSSSAQDNREAELIQRKKTEQIFRIHLGALVFAAAHLLGHHLDKMTALSQLVRSFIGGVIYGYLAEKYDTLAPAIISHGINNTIALAFRCCPKSREPILHAAILSNLFLSCVLGVTEVDKFLYMKCMALKQRCLRVINWL